MNYRMLFFISILIIGIGVGGLFMMEKQSAEVDVIPQTTDIQSAPPATENNIKVAVANRALKAGDILRRQDYNLVEVKSLPNNKAADLMQFFSEGQTPSLDGFLLKQDIAAGEQINGDMLISPNDEQFFIESVDKNEVAFRVYVKVENQFLLDTLKAGDIVSLYAQQPDYQASRENREGLRFDELLKNLMILKVERFIQNDETPQDSIYKNYVGYISLKMPAEQLLSIFKLPQKRDLLVLPKEDKPIKDINSRGLSIRALRG